MSINSRIVTYTTLFTIVIGFLYLGFSSVGNIKSTKLDKKTYYLAKLIEKTNSTTKLTSDLYKTLDNSCKYHKFKLITITDSEGNNEEYYQFEIYYEKIEKLLKKFYSFQKFLSKFENQDFSDKYTKSLEKYNNAIELVIDVTENSLDEIDEDSESKYIIENYQLYKAQLGYNASNANNLFFQARDSLKNNSK